MRTFAIILLLASLFAASCGEPPMPPSDEEMIRHFATHEAAFRKVYEIMAESSEGSFHYPPLSPEEVIILPSYMSGYESEAYPFWTRNALGTKVGNYAHIKKALGYD